MDSYETTKMPRVEIQNLSEVSTQDVRDFVHIIQPETASRRKVPSQTGIWWKFWYRYALGKNQVSCWSKLHWPNYSSSFLVFHNKPFLISQFQNLSSWLLFPPLFHLSLCFGSLPKIKFFPSLYFRYFIWFPGSESPVFPKSQMSNSPNLCLLPTQAPPLVPTTHGLNLLLHGPAYPSSSHPALYVL